MTLHTFVLPSDTSILRGLILVDFVDGTWSGIWPSDTQTEWLLVIARFISINVKHEQARRAFKKYHINWIVEVRQIYAWFYATVASNRFTSLHNLDANFLIRLCRACVASSTSEVVSLFAILSWQSITYLLLKAFIKRTNDSVRFHEEDIVLLWDFERC